MKRQIQASKASGADGDRLQLGTALCAPLRQRSARHQISSEKQETGRDSKAKLLIQRVPATRREQLNSGPVAAGWPTTPCLNALCSSGLGLGHKPGSPHGQATSLQFLLQTQLLLKTPVRCGLLNNEIRSTNP